MGKYSKNPKEVASIEEGINKPFAKESNNKLLVKDGNWAGYNDEPLATKAIGCAHSARQRQAPCHKRQLGHNLW
jgi:hypothetical protein